MSDALRQKCEKLIALGDRIAGLIGEDAAAIEKGRTSALHSLDPTIQQLMMLYTREAGQMTAAAVKILPAELRQKLTQSAKSMTETLTRHQRIIARVKNASEGMIRAIAREVERRRSSQRSYAPTPAARPQSNGAMLYNSVV